LQSFGEDLKFVLITSSATVVPVASEAEDKLIVTASAHKKCERCWHYRADVGVDHHHAGLCVRCVANLFGGGESRRIA